MPTDDAPWAYQAFANKQAAVRFADEQNANGVTSPAPEPEPEERGIVVQLRK